MKLPKIRELAEAIKALFSRPYTSGFPRRPHVPPPSFRGQPRYDAEHCVGCLACEEICPVEAIAHRDVVDASGARRQMIHYTDTCIFCGCCEAACIADPKGIRLTNEWDLAFFDRKTAFETIEKDLQLCEVCGRVIGCRDHLRWITDRLGELSFSSPTLYQAHLKSLGVADENVASAVREGGRSDRFKILCAQCRRKTTLTTAEHGAERGGPAAGS